MAESTLTLSFTDLQKIVGDFLGYGRDVTVWSTDQTDRVDEVIQEGLRQFYSPPPIGDGQPSHRWSFLCPVTPLVTIAGQADYDLSDDYGGIEGDMTFDSGESYLPVVVTGEGQIRKLRQGGDTSGPPRYAAVQPKANDGTTPQRFTLMLWPTPGGEYNLSYRYHVLPQKLGESRPYHLGGSMHSETVRESCLDAAERKLEDGPGAHRTQFIERLATSIQRDRVNNSTQVFGNMGDPPSESARVERAGLVTFGGVAYP